PTSPPPATYTLSLHDALPISAPRSGARPPPPGAPAARPARPGRTPPAATVARPPRAGRPAPAGRRGPAGGDSPPAAARSAPASRDRKSTRLNSSHVAISYAVF